MQLIAVEPDERDREAWRQLLDFARSRDEGIEIADEGDGERRIRRPDMRIQ
jgi:hypothetical protein